MKIKLYTRCSECGENINYYSWETTRANLQMQKGRFVEIDCKHCGKVDNYYLNNLRAEKSNIALIVSFIIFALGTPAVFFLLWDTLVKTANLYFMIVLLGVILVPSIMYGLILKDERKKINSFNRFKIKEEA